ncbi:helix-turn-helix domain-containing protein [Virgibacillus proomii]|uniref:helix-turn-helix domain-containing protein n=1 Tax=Virgibacillus proomii TaxID=84407 RepID=UPI001C1035C3|nr:helix-turn-helix transcriptional regulator [Virgibacillus proomii]MBU5265727.1 helix-turn-helix domain-containing protein [Virgibacillus proomii]
MSDFPIEHNSLYVIRKVYRLTMAEMAKILEVSPTYINAIEKEREPLTDNIRLKLIKQFKLNPARLAEINAIHDRYTYQLNTLTN